MKKRNPILTSIILIFLSYFDSNSVWSAPTADQILQACQSVYQDSSFQTQHLIYQTTVVMTQGTQAPVTNVQTIEIYKALPNLMKMTTNNGFATQTMISNGGYLYIQDPGTGKFVPVKGLAPGNPFQSLTQSLATNFASATLDQSDPTVDEITVTGGSLPNFVAQALIDVDPSTNTITSLEGDDVNGNQVLTMDMTYQAIGKYMQLKTLISQVNYKTMSVSTTVNVLTDEINQTVASSVFAVQ